MDTKLIVIVQGFVGSILLNYIMIFVIELFLINVNPRFYVEKRKVLHEQAVAVSITAMTAYIVIHFINWI